MRGLWIILLAATSGSALGAERPAFQTLSYNEDWSLTRRNVAYLFGDFVKEFVPGQKNGNYVSVVVVFRF
jgi:hypothetical protein